MGWHERCTAILVASMMILSVYFPHGGHDEEDHVTALEGVGVIMEKGREQWTPKDFFTGGDLNIKLEPEGGSEDFEGLDLYGLESHGCGQDEIIDEKK